MSTRPNILFIMSDDHAYQAMGCYGSRINTTPNMDRIAREGVRFDHCYVSNSICTPSRAAILTGTYNHVNGVTTLSTHIDNRLPNVAKHLRTGGYETALIGKWHLGQGPGHWPTGFDFWSVLPGQGIYHDPVMFEMGERRVEPGYVTDVITDKTIDWLEHRDTDKPFFLMCHHKAPHRPWDPKPEYRDLYTDPIETPETFDDDYANRASAAEQAHMRIAEHMTFRDLDLVQLPETKGNDVGWGANKIIPFPEEGEELAGFSVRCMITGEEYTFSNRDELKRFKYQRYLRKYLQCVHSIDESVGRLLEYLDDHGLAENTVVIYTSDQGFYLGEHGWFDKRFIYEESFKMPFIVRYPEMIAPGSVCDQMVSNVDFAQSFLDLAELPQPSYMQGRSIVPLLKGETPEDWPDLAYHRYWMNQDGSHNAYAHYGIRTKRYKIVYWYNEDCGQPGANPGTDTPEWELFDLEEDPLELNNVYHDPRYGAVAAEMKAKLEQHMLAIGDTPMHEVDGA